MERVISTALPLAFLAHLAATEAMLARRRIALGGRPAVDRRLFLACKYASIAVWAAVAAQGWGIGFPLLPAGFWLRGLSLSLWMLGFILLCAGRISLGGHFRIGLPNEATVLRFDGAYGFSRNPMYAGLDATMLAAILYTRNPAILALGALVIGGHHRIILAEERWLRRRFGEAYERYRDRVGRYVTLPWRTHAPAPTSRSAAPSGGCAACPGMTPGGRLACRARSLQTLSRMGHCAPTIMHTLLDGCGPDRDWLVRLTSGLPGGIGNTGGECGGITSILLLLGLRLGLRREGQALPAVFDLGREHLRRFRGRNGTLLCRQIRGEPPRILPCVRAVATSPELLGDALSAAAAGRNSAASDNGARSSAHTMLYNAFAHRGFHCAHSVLHALDPLVPVSPRLLDATGPFVGGTVLQGMTCSALAAGVMALGLRLGEIETSRWRTIRMVALLATGGPAFDDRINKFNRTMNLGNQLARWFSEEFGGIQCRQITQADFASIADVRNYLRDGGIASCAHIADKVAERVRVMLEEARVSGRLTAEPRRVAVTQSRLQVVRPLLGTSDSVRRRSNASSSLSA